MKRTLSWLFKVFLASIIIYGISECSSRFGRNEDSSAGSTPDSYSETGSDGRNDTVQHYLPEDHSGELILYEDSGFPSRNWPNYMRMPSSEEVNAVKGTGRSPYIAVFPHYPGVNRVLQYSVDVHIDHDPKGTYVCPLNWWMDVSGLQKKFGYNSVYNDYTGTPGGYCGFQCLEDGSKVFIMTVWSTFCTDQNGRTTVYKPSVIYPENEGEENQTSDEGSFVHCILPYSWKTGRDYRILVQQGVSDATGNVTLTAWIGDCSEGSWKMLSSFDTGVSDVWMVSGAAFLENFLVEYAGEVRTMELFNLRACSADTGAWVSADSADFILNGSISSLDYIGSCSFGTDGASIFAITSGVSGLCVTPSDAWTRQLAKGDSGDPLQLSS